MSLAVLTADVLDKSYGAGPARVAALVCISLELAAGELVALTNRTIRLGEEFAPQHPVRLGDARPWPGHVGRFPPLGGIAGNGRFDPAGHPQPGPDLAG